ncbi:MAG: DegT/DnrJ/EryC1/StrS family aminotransferase [Gammaproteobacteria bacterium]
MKFGALNMQGLKDLPISLPPPQENSTRHAYHLVMMLIGQNQCGVSRDEFLDSMNTLRVGTGVHYLSLPEHPYYRERFGWEPEQLPNAIRIGRQIVSLPLSSKLSYTDVKRVIKGVWDILGISSDCSCRAP